MAKLALKDAAAKAAKNAEQVEENVNVNPIEENEVEQSSAAEVAPTVEPVGDIEFFDDIPIPTGRAPREAKYKWDDLSVNQSFFVPGAKSSTFHTLTATRNKKGSKKFVAKKYSHKGVEGVMVWRIA